MSVIYTSSSVAVNAVCLLLIVTVSIGNAQQQQSTEGIRETAVTSRRAQQQQQQQLLAGARFRLESTSDSETQNSTVSTVPTISVAAGVNDMSLKQLLQPSSSLTTATNDSNSISAADDYWRRSNSETSYKDGDYSQRGDYYDDYHYDYSYNYNSYESKDDLRYDYNSNHDYRRHGPVYNYSIHHPDETFRHMMPSSFRSRSEPINMSLLVIYLWLALVAVMIIVTVVIFKYKHSLEAASHRCVARICCRHRRSVGVDEGNTLLSHSLV